MSYKKDLKQVMSLYPEALTTSRDDFRHLINIHNIAKSSFGSGLKKELVLAAYNSKDNFKLNNGNDYYYLLFRTASLMPEFKKTAYPMAFESLDVDPEFDVDKWSELVYKIYDTVESGEMTLDNAIDYYSGELDPELNEDEKFKKWIKYYQDGEHIKYNSLNNIKIYKQAYQFPLSGVQNYRDTTSIISDEFKKLKNNKDNEQKNADYLSWRNKLYAAIRRIDKLLRQSDSFVDLDTHRELADLLHNFDKEIRSVKYKVTASDLAFKYANKFKKVGFNDAYEQLMKYSQEMGEQVGVEKKPEFSGPILSKEQEETLVGDTTDSDLEGAIERALRSTTGPSEGEYEELSGDIDIGNAVRKLEEIAGRLSDRRTIRLLAEFDIMLDRLGIASMFPELAEAQSKLIDGYSYALTRVTKMLGMLSSGRSLLEITNAKTQAVVDRTQKEVDKAFEDSDEEDGERGSEKIQEGVDEGEPNQAQKVDSEQAQAQQVGDGSSTENKVEQ